MEQKSFLKRTLIPVLLAVLLVTAMQLIPRQFPAATLPASMDGYDCQVSLLENGVATLTATLTADDGAAMYQELSSTRVQSRGPAGDSTQRYPLLYQLTFMPEGAGAAYELLLDPDGRLIAGGKLYKLQGAKPRAIAETLQGYLNTSTGATGVITP